MKINWTTPDGTVGITASDESARERERGAMNAEIYNGADGFGQTNTRYAMLDMPGGWTDEDGFIDSEAVQATLAMLDRWLAYEDEVTHLRHAEVSTPEALQATLDAFSECSYDG